MAQHIVYIATYTTSLAYLLLCIYVSLIKKKKNLRLLAPLMRLVALSIIFSQVGLFFSACVGKNPFHIRYRSACILMD